VGSCYVALMSTNLKDPPELSLAIAEKAARSAFAKAHELGALVTVCVVDSGGRVVLIMRGDGSHFLAPDTSRAKALAAAAFKAPTKDMMDETIRSLGVWANVSTSLQGAILPTPGGVPIIVRERLLGAIGCGGGTGQQDHECAQAGATSILSGDH
jgi:glc operon protein GlcG